MSKQCMRLATRILELFIALSFLMWASGTAQTRPNELAAEAQATLSDIRGSMHVPGLQQPVTVLRDRWGVAHIYAQDQHDLFFAQGFVAAQDRLFQITPSRQI